MVESIPAHVLFLFDTSMTGDKLALAKDTFSSIMNSVMPKDFFNLGLFNGPHGKTSVQWKVNTLETLACSEANVEAVTNYVNGLGEEEIVIDNYAIDAIKENMKLAQDLSEAGLLPANAISRVVLITDGRGQSETRHDFERQLPVIAIGIGSDANMTFLEQRLANRDGDLVQNIIKDVPVQDQLAEVTKRLHDVIVKDVEIHYLGQNGGLLQSVTQTQFQFLNRGSDLVVSGRADDLLQYLKAVEIKGQMANGPYRERFPFLASPRHLGCDAEITLCSLPAFQGQCVTLYGSAARLNKVKFHKKAVSAQIRGTCSWLVFTRRNFKGKSIQLLPGSHEVLQGALYQSIASLQIAAEEESEAEAEGRGRGRG